ncbi:WcbI family polysaccharide biosynthesis putative acetyltransferase [Oceanidesulfovibrio indonesiensis]|nr:WcbI family polysaccharide biosynthesis putative acetyltransferase [Oceanidesulfovibrio indonesiensis]
MARELCILHANCQGDPLAWLLERHPGFAQRFELRRYVNYLREPVPSSELASAAVLIHQQLGPKWNELASANMRAQLPESATAICLPNLMCRTCWPFWESRPGMDFSDSFLNALQDRGLSKAEILHIACRTDLSRYHDVQALAESSLVIEREKEKDWDIKLTDHIEANYTRRRLFTTINHPCPELNATIARGVLDLLELESPSPELEAAMPAIEPELELPFHPQVASILGLDWVEPGNSFRIYEHRLTYEEYVSHYLDCRSLGESALIAFIRLRHGAMTERGGDAAS